MDWIQEHWLEIFGALSGFIYIFLEIKANKWMWPVGFITSLVYVFVFFDAKFYADMSLQFYYIFISIYGWYLWLKGEQHSNKKEYQISHVRLKDIAGLSIFFVIAFVLISYILVKYTDSPLPYWDTLTTALSIVATWMLAKKLIQHWYLWVVINLIAMGLYIYKDLYPTSILHLVYTIFAVIGYFEWKRMMQKQEVYE
jgi:nicotinamide mononucleotide transporter